MKPITYSLWCCSLLIFGGLVQLRAQDAKGCKDSPVITRFPGSTIYSCKDAGFSQFDFPLPASKKRHVEGEFHFLQYISKRDVPTIQLFRNITSRAASTTRKQAPAALSISEGRMSSATFCASHPREGTRRCWHV